MDRPTPQQLFDQNQGLIGWAMRRMPVPKHLLDDYKQELQIALWSACLTWDPAEGASLSHWFLLKARSAARSIRCEAWGLTTHEYARGVERRETPVPLDDLEDPDPFLDPVVDTLPDVDIDIIIDELSPVEADLVRYWLGDTPYQNLKELAVANGYSPYHQTVQNISKRLRKRLSTATYQRRWRTVPDNGSEITTHTSP